MILQRVFNKPNYYLIRELVRTDFKLRYQGSILGYLWTLLKPLLLFVILYTVFTKFLRIGHGIPNWPLSLLLGLVLWNFFLEATSQSLQSIVKNGSLLRKINIPRYMIPTAATLSAFINMLLNLVVVFVFLILGDKSALGWDTLVIFPLLIIELFAFSISVGLILGTVYVNFRDLDHIWEVVGRALFYLIPIIYPLTLIPHAWVTKIIMLDPLAQIIQEARHVITYRGTPTMSDVFYHQFLILVPLIIVGLTILLAVLIFRRNSKYFAENV
jgi:ABC-2 type transport system permease protein